MNKIEFVNNPLIIHLPEGAGYMTEDLNKETFEKIRIDYEMYKLQEVFTILVDDVLFLDEKGKLTDDESKKARFGKDKKDKNGNILESYSSIYARSMMVAAKVLEGKIKLSDLINKIED